MQQTMNNMTKFNPSNKDNLTYGECLDAIFKITDKADAIQYKKAYVEFTEKHMKTNEPLSALQCRFWMCN